MAEERISHQRNETGAEAALPPDRRPLFRLVTVVVVVVSVAEEKEEEKGEGMVAGIDRGKKDEDLPAVAKVVAGHDPLQETLIGKRGHEHVHHLQIIL